MMKAYPIHKDSGVEWLGSVPSHWEKIALKHMATEDDALFIDGDWIESKDLSESGIRYITTGNVGLGKYKEQGSGYITEQKFSELNCTEVFPNDLLISRLNSPIGRSCLIPELNSRIVTSVDNVILRPNSRFSKRYLVYLFSSNEYINNNENLARGATMQRISRGLLGNVRVIVPETFEEQEKIADYLNVEVGQIDNLIFEKQNFIKLLEEKRQALISHVVTKGLDDKVAMKDSGVEWLGEVPKHWTLVKAKHVSKIFIPQRNKPELSDSNGTPWITMKEMRGTHVSKPSLFVEYEHALISGSKVLPSDSVIASCVGEFGIASINKTPVIINQQLQAYQPFNINPEYLRYIVTLSKAYFEKISTAATLAYVNQKGFEQLPVPLPSLTEQKEICSYLLDKCTKIKVIFNETQNSIRLLKERRSALISAAVTGKIDVREYA